MRRTCFEQDFVPEKIRPSQAFRQGPREGGRRSGAFKDDGDALADTDAHGAEGVAPVGAQELVERGGAIAIGHPLAPSGWPMAIAPPLGLTCGASSGIPRSRRTASACEAKASFSSMTSI